MMTIRPTVGVPCAEAETAVDAFAAGLQAGHDGHDAEILNRQFATDVIWGSPFSEMAMYVLVRRDGRWWLAAGQNTPIRPGGAVAAAT